MQRLFISLVLFLSGSISLIAQDAYLSFIDEDKKEFFRKNEWELYYANEDINFYDFVIYNGNLVIAESEHHDYKIHFLNESRLIEKSKVINGSSKQLPLTPKLYIDKNDIAFAPFQKFECRIVPEKERVRKGNRLNNYLKRSKGELFKKYLHYDDFTFYSFASLNKATGYQKVEIQYGKNEKNLSTLYVAKMESDHITYSWNSDRVEIEFSTNFIFLVDNFSKKFLVIDFEGEIIASVDLSGFDDSQEARFFSGALLRKDPISNKVYLIKHNNLYEIIMQKDDPQLIKIELMANFNLFRPRIYSNHLYNIFSTGEEDGRAIYRKKLN